MVNLIEEGGVNLEFDYNKKIMFKYKNWKGETSWRHVYPIEMRYGNTEWHKEDQWLLKGWDFIKSDYREFAMKDIIKFY
jgi:predicted DNA-binding transcriptional regulator YafY